MNHLVYVPAPGTLQGIRALRRYREATEDTIRRGLMVRGCVREARELTPRSAAYRELVAARAMLERVQAAQGRHEDGWVRHRCPCDINDYPDYLAYLLDHVGGECDRHTERERADKRRWVEIGERYRRLVGLVHQRFSAAWEENERHERADRNSCGYGWGYDD